MSRTLFAVAFLCTFAWQAGAAPGNGNSQAQIAQEVTEAVKNQSEILENTTDEIGQICDEIGKLSGEMKGLEESEDQGVKDAIKKIADLTDQCHVALKREEKQEESNIDEFEHDVDVGMDHGSNDTDVDVDKASQGIQGWASENVQRAKSYIQMYHDSVKGVEESGTTNQQILKKAAEVKQLADKFLPVMMKYEKDAEGNLSSLRNEINKSDSK